MSDEKMQRVEYLNQLLIAFFDRGLELAELDKITLPIDVIGKTAGVSISFDHDKGTCTIERAKPMDAPPPLSVIQGSKSSE